MNQNLDPLKVHPRVMRDLRKSGHSEEAIADMTPEQAFAEFCRFNGFGGNWGQTLASVLDSLRASRVAASVEEVMASPAVSDWAKRTIRSALQRDAVDATNDAQLVRDLLVARLDQMLRTDPA